MKPKARAVASSRRELVLPLCCVLLWAPQGKTDTAILERTPSPVPPHCPAHFPLASECWALGANGHQSRQDGAVLARSGAGRRQALAEERRPGTGTPLPVLAVAAWAPSLLHGEGPPVPGGMGQANCCCGSRWAPPAARGHAGTAGPHSSGISHARRSLLCREALTDIEPVLSADVRLSRGRKRSERRLLLLREELLMAKLQ